MANAARLAESPLRGFGAISGVTAESGPLNPNERRVHPEGGPQPFQYWLRNGTPRAEVEVRFSAAMPKEVYTQRWIAMVSTASPVPESPADRKRIGKEARAALRLESGGKCDSTPKLNLTSFQHIPV
jgi:hypothetical protein